MLKSAFIGFLFVAVICTREGYGGPVSHTFKADTNQLKEVSISGKRSLAIRGHSADTSSFDHLNALNVADILKRFSGTSLKDYGGIGGLKTVSIRSLDAGHTSLLVDGIPVRDLQSGQIDFGRMSLYAIESISIDQPEAKDELQQASAFASAGVVSIRSIRPEFADGSKQKITAALKAGSFNLFSSMLLWQQKISNAWSASVNANWQQADGDYAFKLRNGNSDSTLRRQNGDVNLYQADAALYGSILQKGDFYFKAGFQDSERGLPGGIVYYNTSSRQRLFNKDYYFSSSYKYDLSSKLSLKASLRATDNHINYLDPDYLNNKGGLDQQFHQTEYLGAIAARYELSQRLVFNYSSDLVATRLATNLPQYVYPERTTWLQHAGVHFLHEDFRLNIHLLSTSIREKVRTGTSSPDRFVLSPSVYFSTSPFSNDKWLLNFSYKNTFKYPTFNDLYYTNFGNRNLKPEKVNAWQTGLTYGKGNGHQEWYWSGNLFYNKVDNRIIAVPNQNLYIWTVRNIGKVEIYGFESTLSKGIPLRQNWLLNLEGNYTFQLALDKSDPGSTVYNDQLPYTPKHTFNLQAGIQLQHFYFYWNQSFQSGRYYLSENEPAYYIPSNSLADVSFGGDVKIFGQTISPLFEVNNLFNQSYEIVKSFPMPGTSFRITIKTIL